MDSPPHAQPSICHLEKEAASLLPQLTPRRSCCSATVHANAAEDSNAAETAIQYSITEEGATSNMASVAVNMLSPANIVTSIHSMQRSITDLNNSITTIMAQQQASSLELFLSDSTHFSSLSVAQPVMLLDQLMLSHGVSPEILPAIDVVSESLRKQILEGELGADDAPDYLKEKTARLKTDTHTDDNNMNYHTEK